MIILSNANTISSQMRCFSISIISFTAKKSSDIFDPASTRKAQIDENKCVGCGRCIGVCHFNAIANQNASGNDALNCKIAKYAKVVVDGRPHFHVSIIHQVSPYCDCNSENDAAIIPDVRIFASFDPIALDHVCIDAVNAEPAVMTSIQSERTHSQT